jgi:hypothetical protein
MTTIQEVLFELEGDYLGHPYFVSGHALFRALARRLDDAVCRSLQVSTGVFVPGTHGSYPAAHSRTGNSHYMGTGLRPVDSYADLFLYRDAAQRWIAESQPREALNTHGLRQYGTRTAYSPTRVFGRPPDERATKETMTWHVHCFLHAPGETGAIPLDAEVLDGLRVGGARNFGLGQLSVAESREIDLTTLDYSRLREADEYTIDLLAPYVLNSEYSGADSQDIPWWWACDEDALRRRTTRLVAGADEFAVETIDHGQVVTYAGDDPVATAQNGVTRVGTHAKFGFGEFRVRPASADRVAARATDDTAATRGGLSDD